MPENQKKQLPKMSELNIQSLFDYLTDMIALCTPDYEIIDSNNSANVIFGKGDRIVGSKCYEMFRAQNEPCSDCPLPVTIESGRLTPLNTFDERFGEYFDERTHPIMSETGELQGFILICRNETKARELEGKFAQAKKLASIGQISSGVAHDFNNVLTGVLGRVLIMKNRFTDSELLKHLQVIETAAQDGAATVRRMQDFTRARKDIEFESIELKQLIEDVVALTRPKWHKASEVKGTLISVVLDLDDDLIIMGDRPDLRNAFTNLIFNAVDAMTDGGVVSIRSEKKDLNIILRVKDTGIGMTQEIQDRIFDPFFTTKGVKGTGMGMTEVYGVVKRHNGRITLASEIGKGTVFTLIFPLAEEVDIEIAPKETYEFVACKILIIDDEEYVLEVTKELLEEVGHQATGYTSAQEALDSFQAHQYDIVITDLGMPEMSGQELAERIKAINHKTPIILLSGWAVNLEEEKDLGKVIDFAITKPFTIEGIQGIVSQAVRLSQKLRNAEAPVQSS